MAKGDKTYFIEEDRVLVVEDAGDGTSALYFFVETDGAEYTKAMAAARAQQERESDTTP